MDGNNVSYLPGVWYFASKKMICLKSEQKVGAISIAHSFSTRGERWSGPGDYVWIKISEKARNLIWVTKDS